MGDITRRGLLAAAASAAALPAAAAPDAALIEAARKEGEVVWYSSLIINQIVRPMAEGFSKKYPGITVKYSRNFTNEIALKLTNEARAGKPQSDVFDGSASIFTMVKPELMEKYAGAAAAAEGYPPELYDPDGYYAAPNSYFLVPAINTEMVSAKDAPKTYADLLDPKWKGRIAWTNDPTLNGPPGFIGNIMMTMGPDAGMDYLRKLAAQRIVNVPAAQRVVLDQVIGGQYAIGLMTFNNHSVISAEQGAPVQWLKTEPVVATHNYIMLTKGGPNPNAGRLFIAFVLSDEGQRIMQQANYIPASPRIAAKVAELKPSGGNFKATTMTPATADRHIADWQRIYNELFK